MARLVWACAAAMRLAVANRRAVVLGGVAVLASALSAPWVAPAHAGDAVAERFEFTGTYRFARPPGTARSALHLPPEAVPIPVPGRRGANEAARGTVPASAPRSLARGLADGKTVPLLPTPARGPGGRGRDGATGGADGSSGSTLTRSGLPNSERSTLGAVPARGADGNETTRTTGPATAVVTPGADAAAARGAASERTTAAVARDAAGGGIAIDRGAVTGVGRDGDGDGARQAERSRVTAQSQPASAATRAPTAARSVPGSGRTAASSPPAAQTPPGGIFAPTPPWAERAFRAE